MKLVKGLWFCALGAFIALLFSSLAQASTEQSDQASKQVENCSRFFSLYNNYYRTLELPLLDFDAPNHIKKGAMAFFSQEKYPSIERIVFYKSTTDLYQVFTLKVGSEGYYGIVKLYPSVSLISFSQNENPNSEIEKFAINNKLVEVAGVKPPVSTVKNTETSDIAECLPIDSYVSKKHLRKGEDARFMRHHKFGRYFPARGVSLCPVSGDEFSHIRFYEVFSPYIFQLGDVEIFVDPAYPGSTSGEERGFNYICNYGLRLEGRKLPKIQAAGLKKGAKEVVGKGIETSYVGDDFYSQEAHQWEQQLIANILKGRYLFEVEK